MGVTPTCGSHRSREIGPVLTAAALLVFGACLTVTERRSPLRHLTQPAAPRQLRNLAIAALAGAAVGLLEGPIVRPVTRAVERRGLGLLHLRPMPSLLRTVLGVATLMLRMADRLSPDWEIDVEDLGNVYGRAKIQSCNACVSTGMALCCWPCNCYEKHAKAEPDLMWDLDLYARLDLADAWAFIAPVNWYGPSSNLKLLFDRLVCANGGNPDETSIDHKNPEKAMALEHAAEWDSLSQNHLEGRTAGFFCYEDEGGDEIGPDGRPKKLRHKAWFDANDEPFEHTRDAYRPLVWQCRYSGVEVPDDLWMGSRSGVGQAYSDNQAEDMVREPEIMRDFNAWTDRFAAFVAEKGKVPPGRFRAYGYEPPGHRIAEAKLAWRDLRMRFGHPPAGSSPAVQQAENLNRDVTLRPKASEADRRSD